MIFVNHLTKQPAISKSTVETFTIILNPFMPHLSEEIWSSLGKNSELLSLLGLSLILIW